MRVRRVFREFLVDAPRANIWVDGTRHRGHPVELFLRLQALYGRKDGLRLASRCTQGWLAHWYSVGVDLFCRGAPEKHLVSDGYQEILIRSRPRPHLVTTKPFSLVQFSGRGEEISREEAILSLTYRPDHTPHTECHWFSGDEAAEWAIV